MRITIGSLFDGSGGFPLAGALCGFDSVWASEVEPYPIAVTRSRFPNMKHLGDISKINGAEIEPVEIITFGSPCQGLSVAGTQKGLNDKRSALFMEAIRIIKEMRGATNGEYPKWAIWENVPGAFSSNAGQDFRAVLEELIKIAEPNAAMPKVPKKGWAYADSYIGNGWSLAYRVLDAQYIRTAQRRRRIYLVLDLGGQRARKVLFERESLCGYSSESRTTWQGNATDVDGGVGADYRVTGIDVYNQAQTGDKSKCLTSKADTDHIPCAAYSIENHPADSRVVLDDRGKVQTLTSRMGTGGGNVPMVLEHKLVYCLQGNGIDRADTAGCNGKGWREDVNYTLNTIDRPAVVYAMDRASFNQGENAQYNFEITDSGVNSTIVAKGPSAICYAIGNGQAENTGLHKIPGALNCMHDQQAVLIENKTRYIVRRLTPTECARLQGFPDLWGHPDKKTEFTDEEYRFWLDVRNTHAEINGKKVKDYTKKQMLTWYNKLHSDSAEYKLWGNGIALPCALYVMQGIANTLEGEK